MVAPKKMRPKQTTFFQNSWAAGGGEGTALLLAAAASATMFVFALLCLIMLRLMPVWELHCPARQ
jgi:hypothetical protein